MLLRWSKETATYACLNVYRDPVSKRLLSSQEPFAIPYHDLEVWRNQVLMRILTAGARVAVLINAIVENQEGRKEGEPVKELKECILHWQNQTI